MMSYSAAECVTSSVEQQLIEGVTTGQLFRARGISLFRYLRVKKKK